MIADTSGSRRASCVSVAEAARILGVHRSTVYRLLDRGDLVSLRHPAFKNRQFIDRTELERFESRWEEVSHG